MQANNDTNNERNTRLYSYMDYIVVALNLAATPYIKNRIATIF